MRVKRDVFQNHPESVAGMNRNMHTIFFPVGNTIAAPTDILVEVFTAARQIFPKVNRMTVYGSAQYVLEKQEAGLRRLAEAGLTRIHLGLESGHDDVLSEIKKGLIGQGR